MSKSKPKAADFIQPLFINGLHGRIMHMTAPKGKKREIMYVQGHHTSLERNFGVAQYLNNYGAVTVPDLPGFGGMDAFYKIREKPTLDNLADYLATFIKLRYKKRKFTIVGLSLGFAIVTRMLQKHPELSKQVDVVISFAGLVSKKDFNYKKRVYYPFRSLTWFLSLRIPGAFVKYVLLRKFLIRLGYKYFEPIFVNANKTKIRKMSAKKQKELIDFEVGLWQSNEPRTYMYVGHDMLTLNLAGTHVDCKVYHVAVEGDRYFNNVMVEQHMGEIYKDVKVVKSKIPSHAPTIIGNAKEAEPFVPPEIRKLLNKAVK